MLSFHPLTPNTRLLGSFFSLEASVPIPSPLAPTTDTSMHDDPPMNDASTEVLSKIVVVETPSSSLDPQPLHPQPGGTSPQGQPEPGMSSVAQFLPPDAKRDHETPPPSQPLDEFAGVRSDTVMDDAPSLADLNASDPAQPVTSTDELASPATNGTDAAAGATADVAPAADIAGTVDGILNGEKGPTGPAIPSASESVVQVQAELPPIAAPASDTSLDVDSAVTVPTTDTSLDVDSAVTAPTTDTSLPVKSVASTLDEPVSDVQAGGTIRPRDEDESHDERSAKRTRTDEPAATEQAHFKLPETTTATPVPPSAPGSTSDPAVKPAPTAVPATTATPASLTNGASSHLPPRSTYSTNPMTPAQKTVLLEKLKNTKKVKSALAFLRPVRPEELNIPHYPNIIKNPMDLGTMDTKLKSDEYPNQEAFVSDFELMVNNCFTFNGPVHAISAAAQSLRAYFLKQMDGVPTGGAAVLPTKPTKKASPIARPPARRESRVSLPSAQSPNVAAGETFALLPGGTPQIRRESTAGRPKRAVVPPAPRDLPYSGIKPKRKENQVGLKFCEHVLEELRKAKYREETMYFLSPVDPVALNIPTYYSVIKKPMDIGTIAQKLKNGQYSTADEFKADFELMLDNCYRFNPPDNFVYIKGKELGKSLAGLWADKGNWEKRNQPASQRASSASDVESDAEESEDEDPGDDEKEATITQLKNQLAAMQGMLSNLTAPGKRASPKAGSKKKKSASGVTSTKSKKSSTAALAKTPSAKTKSKKQRLVSYDEKQEISNAAENMTEDQINKLTQIITENAPKYKVCVGRCVYNVRMLTFCRTCRAMMSNLRLMISRTRFSTSC